MKKYSETSVKRVMPKPTFVIRNCDPSLLNYIKRNWGYFIRRKLDDCAVVIRKTSVFIHVDSYYCVIFNAISFMNRNPQGYHLEMNAKAKKMLHKYNGYRY